MSSILLILVRYSDSKSKESSFFKNHSLTILKVGNSWAKLQIWVFSAGQIPKSKINIWATLVSNLFPYFLPFLKKEHFYLWVTVHKVRLWKEIKGLGLRIMSYIHIIILE